MSRSHIHDASSFLNNIHYSNNNHSFNCTHFLGNDFVWNVNNIGTADERSEILAWLSPLEPRIRHQYIRTRRADKVGEWLLETDKFLKWCNGTQDESEHTALFCCGDPAVGKTYFSSLVVDKLCDKAKEENIAVACFYVDFAAREEQSPTNMLGSLLKQIVGGLEKIPDDVGQTFRDYKKVIGGRGLRVPEILKMLQAVTSLQPTFICIDALDECVEAYRPEVLDSLRQILEKSPNTRLFLTGRRHIRGEIDRHLARRAVVLCIKPNNDDIMGYIRMRLSKDTSLDAIDSGLEAEIIKSIAENISETFLPISLTMDAILGETTAFGRRQKLKAVTDGLDLKHVYGMTLERIKGQCGEKAKLGMAALMWISHSERLLQLDELLHALAVQKGSTDLNAELIPSVEALLSSCLGLVVVDREALTVRLIHFTLQEHLRTCPDFFGVTHSTMAETCLTYLNSPTIQEISPVPFVLPQSTPFLKYSSLYWGAHARRGASRDVVSLALKLFHQIETHISTRLLLLNIVSKTGRYHRDIPLNGRLTGFTGLHCASVFGIVEIVSALRGQPNYDLNKGDFLGITPLIWAAICGQEGVAKLLLDQENVIPDKPDKCFRRAALSWAAGKGHEGMVRLFLGRASTKPDKTDGWWGNVPRVVNMTLGRRYVNPNRPDIYGQTPVALAAEAGHESVVGLLLERQDVKPDAADGYGRAPLLLASSNGHEGVVKLLVEHEDVNINEPDTNGRTPFLSAADSGYEGVVGLLLRVKDINPNAPGRDGQTPLSLASAKGHDEVVRLLLGWEGINPDIPDKFGQTPLLWAAMNGHNGVVRLLLGQKEVNPGMPDRFCQTPILSAAKNGHAGVVELLLTQECVNPNMLDNGHRTPLLWAARNGHGGVAKLLLAQEDVSPNIPDNGGRTPLLWATMNGRDGVVRLLLGREDVNPDMPDNDGQTPLSWAARSGRDGAVKLLLRLECVDPDVPDNFGQTPLSWAAKNGHGGVVKLLLGQGGVRPDKPSNGGQTPLSRAAMNGHDGVVKLLLGWEGVNPDIPDNDGKTPLGCAANNGHDGVVKLLLGWEGVSPDVPDNCGRTPLSRAACNGHDGVVKLLLGSEGVNPHGPDNIGRTPLSWAAINGHDGVVKLLLGREGVGTNLPDKDGKTPISWAAENRHASVVKVLQAHASSNPSTA